MSAVRITLNGHITMVQENNQKKRTKHIMPPWSLFFKLVLIHLLEMDKTQLIQLRPVGVVKKYSLHLARKT